MLNPLLPDDESGFDLVVTQTGPQRSLLRLEGELDLVSAPVLANTLEAQVATGRIFIDLDLAQLRFCDATGLGVLAKAHVRCKEAGGRLLLRYPSRVLRRLLNITGLDDALSIEPPRAGARIFLRPDGSDSRSRPASPRPAGADGHRRFDGSVLTVDLVAGGAQVHLSSSGPAEARRLLEEVVNWLVDTGRVDVTIDLDGVGGDDARVGQTICAVRNRLEEAGGALRMTTAEPRASAATR